MGTFESILSFAVVGLSSGAVGFLLGGVMASSKIGGLYDRLEQVEEANRVQAMLLDDLAQALKTQIGLSPTDNQASPDGEGGNKGARQILERLALATELRARLEERDSMNTPAS